MKKCTTGRLDKVPPSGIRKFFDLLAGMEGVISMGVGEPDFSTPWNITEAAIRSLEQGFTMYTSNAGMPELRQELAAYLKRTYGVELRPQHRDPDHQRRQRRAGPGGAGHPGPR